jgi:hypothetical protein
MKSLYLICLRRRGRKKMMVESKLLSALKGTDTVKKYLMKFDVDGDH